MVFHFGAAGTAQQLKTANAGTPPTGVSIAENASSGQDDAFRVTDAGPDIFTVAYSDWSGSSSESFGTQYEVEVSAGDLGDFDDYGVINLDIFAYCRATGATSFSWSGSVYSDTFGSGSGDPSGSVPGAGRGGSNMWPQNGDNIIYKLTATATNSDGSTTADLYLKYSFTN